MPDVVVVIGAGPGLGQAIGQAFVQHGDQVVLIARNEKRLRETAVAVGGIDMPVDVTDEPALRAAFATIRSRYGDPTVLVHNPSLAVAAPATETPLEALLSGFRLAAGSLLVAAQEVAPAMREAGRGTILVTGNSAALTGSTWSAALAAQKAAARNLAMSLAAELGPAGVRVVTITINGVLGRPGFELPRIAATYVELAALPSTASHQPELRWPLESDAIPPH
ncbi:MAG TPA: SDR family NAD(P)-dependent oxidoreductase [Jiangellaceae bacterium]